jgi:mycothiol synthase
MHHVEIKRRMGEADIAAISVLVEAATVADGHRALGEHQWLDLVQGRREGFAGFVARAAGRERVVAYAQISRGNDGSWAVEYVVHPRWRADGADIPRDLLSAALGEIAAQGGGHVHLWVPKPSPTDDVVAEMLGLRRGRDLIQMRRSLPIVNESASIAVRPFRIGSDEESWLEVNNRAFRGHPEQGSWELSTLIEREHQPWFDPAGFLLHERDGRLAGFCWTKIHEPDDSVLNEGIEQELGEIYVIAVDPDFQGRGLGRQLVLAGLASLWDRGVGTAMLYVDHDNEGARKLYFSLGFADDHLDRAYVTDVRATDATQLQDQSGGLQGEAAGSHRDQR